MIQGRLFPDPSPDCSRDAHDGVDTAHLARLVEQEYLLFPHGAIADEVAERLRLLGHKVDEFSIRPRVSELKEKETLIPTGKRRNNRKGNSCAVLVHKNHWKGEL